MHVESGHFILEGILQGTLNIHQGVSANISGSQQRTVKLDPDTTVSVTGAIQGTTTVYEGATLIIEASGRLAGALSNFGKVIIRGVFGGPITNDGEFIVEGDGYILNSPRSGVEPPTTNGRGHKYL